MMRCEYCYRGAVCIQFTFSHIKATKLFKRVRQLGIKLWYVQEFKTSVGTICAIRGRVGMSRAERRFSPFKNLAGGSLQRWYADMPIFLT
ncbi:hypothetical protein RB24_11075 [Herbaspirillum rubrisubalbicans]|uniref:Uncharacterized protein n=1 Tax=Herbaspirillum rubrisubalbicans TaxID=80842 RepID=A0ABX9C311_9BURK|nr:hypothetical protein RB24_11075 [Herbaspirillum rubrisubalbicans]